MGAKCVLPEKIPIPYDGWRDQFSGANVDDEGNIRPSKLLSELNECGITLGKPVNIKGCWQRYVTYTLPPGWRMVDDSEREEYPEFYILDDQWMRRFSIDGKWSMHDCHLKIRKVQEPTKFVRRQEPPKASETSVEAMICKTSMATEADRASLPTHASRKGDFMPLPPVKTAKFKEPRRNDPVVSIPRRSQRIAAARGSSLAK